MTKNRYTKGEWIIRKHGILYQIYADTPISRPDVEKYQVADKIYNKANAHLIAAAPNMYEALQDARSELANVRNFPRNLTLISYIDKVLAKAEGNED